jgi:hypothetical protein
VIGAHRRAQRLAAALVQEAAIDEDALRARDLGQPDSEACVAGVLGKTLRNNTGSAPSTFMAKAVSVGNSLGCMPCIRGSRGS